MGASCSTYNEGFSRHFKWGFYDRFTNTLRQCLTRTKIIAIEVEKKKEASIPIECLIRGHKRDEERVRYNGKKGKKETKCLLIQGKKGNPINELI